MGSTHKDGEKNLGRVTNDWQRNGWIFVDNLKPPDYENNIETEAQFITDLIPTDERIEYGIKSKNILDMSPILSLME